MPIWASQKGDNVFSYVAGACPHGQLDLDCQRGAFMFRYRDDRQSPRQGV